MKFVAPCLLALTMVLAPAAVFAAVAACVQGFESSATVMPEQNFRGVSAVVGDLVYAINGESGSGVQNDVFIYSPIADSWSSGTAATSYHGGACGAVIGNKIYLVAGTTASTTRVYDTESNTWSTVAAYPLALRGCMAAAIDGMLYVAGGRTPGDVTVASGYVYDSGDDIWYSIADLPGAKYSGMGLAYQGSFWTIGGWNNSSMYRYDPGSNLWETMPVLSSGDTNNANVIAPEDPGFNVFWNFGSGDQWVPSADILGFSTSSDEWFDSGWDDLPTAVLAAASVNFHDALFVIAGGATGNGVYTDQTQVFRFCAPYVSAADVYTVNNYEATPVTFTGLNFDDQAYSEYFLEGPDKTEVNFIGLTVVDSQTIEATVPAYLAAGVYDMSLHNAFVQNISGTDKSHPGAVTVVAPDPTVGSITPDTGAVGANVSVTIDGSHFFDTPTVTLTGPTAAVVQATNVVVVASDSITADFNLTGALPGDFDLGVTTDNGAGTMIDAFTVTDDDDDDDNDDNDDDDDDDNDDNDDIDDDDTTPDDDDDDNNDSAPIMDDDDNDSDGGSGGDDDDNDSGCGC